MSSIPFRHTFTSELPKSELANKVAELDMENSVLRKQCAEQQVQINELLQHKAMADSEVSFLLKIRGQYSFKLSEKIAELVRSDLLHQEDKAELETVQEAYEKAKQDLLSLQNNLNVFSSANQSLKEEITTYHGQVDRLVNLLRTKTREACVYEIAFKSTHKHLKSLSEKQVAERLIKRTYEITQSRLIDKSLRALLRNINVPHDDDHMEANVNTPVFDAPTSDQGTGSEPLSK